MTRYSQGRAFEYACRRKLEKNGYLVFRSAGSHGYADLLAGKAGQILFIQCKTNGIISGKDKLVLTEVAKEFGAIPTLAKHDDKGKIIFKEI